MTILSLSLAFPELFAREAKMPHYSWLTIFMQEFKQLSADQQENFLAAVIRYIVDPLKAGQQPPSHIFHKMSGYNIYEFRWDNSGRFRATCSIFVNSANEVEIQWRRIGGHEIYQNP